MVGVEYLIFKDPKDHYVDYHLADERVLLLQSFWFYFGGNMDLNRLEALIGSEKLDKVRNLNILLVGVGGVGGYTFESLVRSGVNNITIVDYDKIDPTNLNRQIITNTSNIGMLKTEEAKKRALSINENINVITKNLFLDENTIKEFNLEKYDYVIDACDSVSAKVLLINECTNKGIKIISSMGTAKKMDATKLKITTLDKTSYDKLAKKLRSMIDKKIQKKITVISSTEEVKNIEVLGSNSYVPAVAGLLITNYIINDVVNKAN